VHVGRADIAVGGTVVDGDVNDAAVEVLVVSKTTWCKAVWYSARVAEPVSVRMPVKGL
jgi:hypothetical protein